MTKGVSDFRVGKLQFFLYATNWICISERDKLKVGNTVSSRLEVNYSWTEVSIIPIRGLVKSSKTITNVSPAGFSRNKSITVRQNRNLET